MTTEPPSRSAAPAHRNLWVPPRVGLFVGGAGDDLHSQAVRLAAELRLPLSDQSGDADLLLVVTGVGLQLVDPHDRGRPVAVEWRRDLPHCSPAASRRGLLARAVGLKRHKPAVVDATAGLGRDAVVLASLGCDVTAVERSPILGAMLKDAWRRVASQTPWAGILRERLTLIVDDARNVLARTPADQAPDVVLVDPMFPPRKKAALPKKELQILRKLVGDDPDAVELFAAARQAARDRVVVKRAPHTPPLAPGPAVSYPGKMVRYDVYLTPTARRRDA